MPTTRSKSYLIVIDRGEDGYGTVAARAIDEAINAFGSEREVISVTTTPIINTASAAFGTQLWVQTTSVIVTVVWREPD